ncbi:Subtilase family protein [Loktanella atrilutea]|uniref:Subtilase family protein n=1 Tax=Loktanella atrilutea TaxID=366533 RepID=A0A1M5F077_LOKAT|nr:S8 family serine peptidase [Loktanella atrilutea]SHF84818.1 Subtilase family protein [Loktanella atrilutea]
MADSTSPALNPALRLRAEPVPEGIEGRGKGQETTKIERLSQQQKMLEREVRSIADTLATETLHADRRLLVHVHMFDDSLAPTHRPKDILPRSLDCSFVAPMLDGYLVEIDITHLKKIADLIYQATNWAVRSDISRVKSIQPYRSEAILRGHSIDRLWDRAVEGARGRFFIVWLRPYADDLARENVLKDFERLTTDGTIMTIEANNAASEAPESSLARRASSASGSVARLLRNYRRTEGVGRAIVEVPSKENLKILVASGAVFRIDPAKPLILAPSLKPEPSDAPFDLPLQPVVAVVDGGFDNPNYATAEAWREAPLIPDAIADRFHGNAVSSLVANAKGINPTYDLPEFSCRFGTIQAVPRRGTNAVILEDDLLDAMTRMASRHRDVRVWNLSFNYEQSDETEFVSSLGHQIASLARNFECLPVISAGNAAKGNNTLLPPADCEAALTIGGRETTKHGTVGNHCLKCCVGPGPQGMLKPELSGHSSLTVAGGQTVIGTSFPTAVYSALSAHAFEQLRGATPDLVKALLINRADAPSHHRGKGWGTPGIDVAPWECPPGTVTLLWTGQLQPGFEYHWDDIPIPDGMVNSEKIKGSGALTAVLHPLVSPYGMANYFSSRIEVSLQHKVWGKTETGYGEKWSNLLGTMKESTLKESEARTELSKWNPIRHHEREMRSVTTIGSKFRVRARLYTRDLYQATLPGTGKVPPQNVAIVLTLRSSEKTSAAYDSVVRQLGAFVESAVIEQDITVERRS